MILGKEDVNGTKCFVVEIVPSKEGLREMVSHVQMPEMEGVDLGELNLANMFKEMSIEQWIARWLPIHEVRESYVRRSTSRGCRRNRR